ncbi:hypothetical protein D9M69_600310 [compost metagenome]
MGQLLKSRCIFYILVIYSVYCSCLCRYWSFRVDSLYIRFSAAIRIQFHNSNFDNPVFCGVYTGSFQVKKCNRFL